MNICSSGHEEIVHENYVRDCPVCAIIKEKDAEIEALQESLAEVTEERDELAKEK